MTKSRASSQLDLNGTGDCVTFALRKAARAVTRLYDGALLEADLRSTQFAILVAIAKKQPVSVRALASLTVIDATTMTRSLALLSSQRLIQIGDRARRREKLVTLTKKGERQLARAVPIWRVVQKRLVTRIGAGQWPGLRGKLGRLVDHAHRVSVRRGPA